MGKAEIVGGILARDASIWSQDESVKASIDNRLGWVYSVDFCLQNIQKINSFVELIRQKGFTNCVLLGMGGSALAPELFNQIYIDKQINLLVLDTCHSEQISKAVEPLDFEETLFIVASKSGGTLETKYLMEYFYAEAKGRLGAANVGKHFVAITDQDSSLERTAIERNFLDIFINPSDIGGRFSALSYFGLVPAALIGVPIEPLLLSAKNAENTYCTSSSPLGVKLAEWMLKNYVEKRDKLAITSDKKYSALVLWIEQLVAESLGKEGHGVLPFWEEQFNESAQQLMSLNLQFGDSIDTSFEAKNARSAKMVIQDIAALGAFFYHWEFAVAYAAAKMGINPFDEPNVSEAKSNTTSVLRGVSEVVEYIKVDDVLSMLESQAGSYLAILVYAAIDEKNRQQIESYKQCLQKVLSVPIVISFGPRYLHSTGQLHKGGKQDGMFLILINQPSIDLNIPHSEYSFNRVLTAQAEGDYWALKKRGLAVNIVRLDDVGKL